MAKSISLPAWLVQLRTTAEAESGIKWHSPEEIATAHREFDAEEDNHLGLYNDIHSYTEADLHGDAATRIAQCLKVGEGAEGGRFVSQARSMGTIFTHPAEFWFDPDTPDTLFCSISDHCPPHLWVPVGQTLESISAALAVYYTGREADPAENARLYAARIRQQSRGREVPDDWVTSRVLLGMTGDMAREENRFIHRATFCRSFDAIATFSEDNRMVRETVFHTLQSFSRVRLEWHTWSQYDDGEGGSISPIAAEITYPACNHGDLIRAYNEAKDTDVPEDVPVDVLAALFGFPIKGLPRIYRVIDECVEPGDITYNLGLAVVTEGAIPPLMACLRKYSTHPAARVRDRVGRYANIINKHELIREMLAVENDDAVRKTLEGLLPKEG